MSKLSKLGKLSKFSAREWRYPFRMTTKLKKTRFSTVSGSAPLSAGPCRRPVVRTLSDAATTAGSEKRRSEVAVQMLKRTPLPAFTNYYFFRETFALDLVVWFSNICIQPSLWMFSFIFAMVWELWPGKNCVPNAKILQKKKRKKSNKNLVINRKAGSTALSGQSFALNKGSDCSIDERSIVPRTFTRQFE